MHIISSKYDIWYKYLLRELWRREINTSQVRRKYFGGGVVNEIVATLFALVFIRIIVLIVCKIYDGIRTIYLARIS